MPLELAHKITEEVENKIYKLQTSYLTSSLIRETTNSILIDHGYDEYRTKLARLGLPPSDMISLIHETSTNNMEIPDLVVKTSQSIFTDYLLHNSFNNFPCNISRIKYKYYPIFKYFLAIS